MAEEAEVTVNQNSSFRLEQPFEAKSTSTNTNTSTSTIDIKPVTQTSNQNIDVKPLTQNSTQTVDLRPVKLDSRQELAVTDPIRTDSSSVLDLRPLVIDICQRTGQASLPPTHVCQPYQHRIGLTLLGMEVFGVVLSGENQTIVEDRAGRPFVTWGPAVAAPHVHHEPLPGGPPRDRSGPRHGEDRYGGLRIRLTG
jgi:hypothetical protein